MKTFGRIFAKWLQNHPQKHYVSQSKLITFRDIAKVDFSNGKTSICDIEKDHSENITNTVVYYDLWMHFREKCQKGAQNH